jgi:hypothetical protein
MRFLFRVIFEAEAGNRAVKDPNFIKNIQGFMDNNKAKAAYFTAVNGNRNAIFILDIPSADTTMNLEELKKGLSAAIR